MQKTSTQARLARAEKSIAQHEHGATLAIVNAVHKAPAEVEHELQALQARLPRGARVLVLDK